MISITPLPLVKRFNSTKSSKKIIKFLKISIIYINLGCLDCKGKDIFDYTFQSFMISKWHILPGMQCRFMWCPLTNNLQKSFIWVSVNWRLWSQFYLHHRPSLCIRHIHHAGKHMPLFLSNHDLQGLMVSPDSWSIIFLSLTNSFCPFSILGMPVEGVGFCRLQHPHNLPALPMAHDRAFWSWAVCSVNQSMGCGRFFKNYMF